MADCNCQSIGRIRGYSSVDPQQLQDHVGHLGFIRGTETRHGQFHFTRRVLEHTQRLPDGGQRRAARLPELERAVGIAADEDPLDGNLVRTMGFDEFTHGLEDAAQSYREVEASNVDATVRDVHVIHAFTGHDPETGALGSWIESEDAAAADRRWRTRARPLRLVSAPGGRPVSRHSDVDPAHRYDIGKYRYAHVETAAHCPAKLSAAIEAARRALEAEGAHEADARRGAAAAQLVGALTSESDLALGVLAHLARRTHEFGDEEIARVLGAGASAVARELAKFGDLGLAVSWQPLQGLNARQAETLRKMLLAVASDPRLVLARLAEQVVRLRDARELDMGDRRRLAMETREIFAPLANRLGVWQLKWELEDLAFRHLEPAEYQRIAAVINEKRADRERYIDALCAELREFLARAGLHAQVYGRPKHIFSIHRKMLRKQLDYEQLYDIRAVRIVCADVAECYAALGLVHGRWPYVQGEFDDYIAMPKDNAYRSIHTAVIGPESKAVEVQIRTAEMHEHAELGVAAHWRYKEGGTRDAGYEKKIEWVRRLLDPVDAADAGSDFIELVRAELFEDRVYALTPKGEVVDLPRDATPLDFAYHLHTDLGHRCRGARVNGKIVPLAQPLANGAVVEIITSKTLAPSRDWMAPEQGFLASPRNRAKVRAWFRKVDEADNRAAGRGIAERELARLGSGAEFTAALVQELKLKDADSLYRLLGEGEISATQLVQAAERVQAAGAVAQPPPRVRPPRAGSRPAVGGARRGSSGIAIQGVGDLPLTLARCCAPVRPQSIVGYVTLGRGVTAHRADCAALIRMRASRPERVLDCAWIEAEGAAQDVELTVVAFDRRGLVRDLSDVVASERLSIESLSTTTDRREGTATSILRVAVTELSQLARLRRRLAAVSNVLSVKRLR